MNRLIAPLLLVVALSAVSGCCGGPLGENIPVDLEMLAHYRRSRPAELLWYPNSSPECPYYDCPSHSWRSPWPCLGGDCATCDEAECEEAENVEDSTIAWDDAAPVPEP